MPMRMKLYCIYTIVISFVSVFLNYKIPGRLQIKSKVLQENTTQWLREKYIKLLIRQHILYKKYPTVSIIKTKETAQDNHHK